MDLGAEIVIFAPGLVKEFEKAGKDEHSEPYKSSGFIFSLRAHLPFAKVLPVKTCHAFWWKIGIARPIPRLVVVADDGFLTERVDPTFHRIFSYYLSHGRTLVFGFRFMGRAWENFFKDTFALQWTMGDRYSGNFVFNENARSSTPNGAAFPEYFSNLGLHKLQSWETLSHGYLIKDAYPHERIYVPCATLEPPNNLLFPDKDTRPRPKDEPANWTYDPWSVVPKNPIADNQTILAGAAIDRGHVFLSGSAIFDEKFWKIIKAIFYVPRESRKRKYTERPNPDGSGDGSPNIHKGSKTAPEEFAASERSSSPVNLWSDLFKPKIGPPPCCNPCAGDELKCARGFPCPQCQKAAIPCDYPDEYPEVVPK